MRVFSNLAAVALAGSLVLGLAACGDKETRATPDDAKAFAEKAAAYLEEVGPDEAFDAFTNSEEWKDGDLYVFVNNTEGVSLAHGFQPELIGTNELDVPDADGKLYVHDIVAIQDAGWVDYKWQSPATGEMLEKTSYIVRVDDYLVGVGAYKYPQ